LTKSVPRHHHSPDWIILSLACLAQFMVVLDVSIVNVALPSIRNDLHFSSTGLQWVVNAYVLTFAGFLLLGGRAADLFGRRRIFLLGLGLFSVASLVGGLSGSSAMLTAARAAQGVGGAVLSPATLTIIMTTFTEGHARNRALGTWSSVAGAGGAAGGILGGVLTSYLSWRWVLFVNVPIGAAAAVAAVIWLSEGKRPGEQRSLDLVGAVTVTAGLAAAVYAIVNTDVHPWISADTLSWLGAAGVLLAAFLVVQVRVQAPLVPLGLFRSRAIATANGVMLLVGAIFFSMWYFLSLYLQTVLGYGPLKAGLAFLPMSAAIVMAAQASSRLMGRLGARLILVVGIMLSAAGFFWISHVHAHGGYVSGVLGAGILIALGIGLSFTPLASVATSGVHYTQAGLASGVLNTSRQVGGSLGLAVLATLATDRTQSVLRSSPGPGLPSALSSGYDRAFLVGSVVAVAAAVVAALVPARRKAVPSTPAPTAVGAPTPAAVGD
jgi:EmrB/QacA subfamily drug resistance transporter